MHQTAQTNPRPRTEEPDRAPSWAQGLRQLYTGVAVEPLPADLNDLLARLSREVHCAG